MLLQLLTNGIIAGVLYAVIALGFALVYNTTRIFHIAYAGIYMTAPYSFLMLNEMAGIPVVPSFAMTIIITAALSLFIEILVYQPLLNKGRSTNVAMISSIGVGIIITNTVAMLYGSETKIINHKLSSSINFGEIMVTNIQISQLSLGVLILAAFGVFIKYTSFGIKIRALRDDQQLYRLMGMNVRKMRYIIFFISGAFAAFGSLLIAWEVGTDPYAGMPMLLNVVVAMILGGLGRLDATVLGGVIIGLVQASAVWMFSPRWQDAVTFALLLAVLLFRNKALLGEKERPV